MNESDQLLPRRPLLKRAGAGLGVAAPAKINLNLLVGPRRADGFHELDSAVAQVSLYDELEILPRDDGQIVFSCKGADCGPDDKNLAMKAARLFADETRSRQGAQINLLKNIPPGKGLGGGSSDAAAVLRGLNELWFSSNVPADMLRLLAARLGSDVPLFLGSPTARMTGRGETLEPINVHDFVAVLILPAVATSTAAVYQKFDELAASAGRAMAPPATRQIDLDEIAARPPSQWRGRLRNDLLAPALRVCPALEKLMDVLRSAAGPAPVCLTGSGSAMFVICDDLVEARRVRSQLPPGSSAVLVQNL